MSLVYLCPSWKEERERESSTTTQVHRHHRIADDTSYSCQGSRGSSSCNASKRKRKDQRLLLLHSLRMFAAHLDFFLFSSSFISLTLSLSFSRGWEINEWSTYLFCIRYFIFKILQSWLSIVFLLILLTREWTFNKLHSQAHLFIYEMKIDRLVTSTIFVWACKELFFFVVFIRYTSKINMALREMFCSRDGEF